MKYIFTFLILLVGASMVQGQDIIVRITGDTLHVKIDHANDQFVYYRSDATKHGELDVISRIEIATVLYNYEAGDKTLLKESLKVKRDYSPFEVTFLYGYYFLPIDYSGNRDFEDYYKDLQNGSGFMTGAQYFVSESFGFGVCYSLSHFSNSLGNLQYTPTGQIGRLQDDMAIQYVGVGIVARLRVPQMNSYFEVDGGVGFTFYKNKAEQIEPYILTGKGMGGHLGVQFVISVGSGLFIPIKAGVYGFEVKNIQADIPNPTSEIGKQLEYSVNAANSLTITRLSASVGLLFAF